MSYNISVARHPVPTNDQEAWEWVGRMADTDNDSPPQVFHELIDLLTAKYPCICDLDDEFLDTEGVWSDGPLRDNIALEAPVLGIVYSKVDEVLPFLIDRDC
jgi:hypothetical protein